MREILLIGAGASGLAAAVTAAPYCRVTVLEREKKPASKLLRTGNGRCNLANASDLPGRYEGSDAGFAEAVTDAHPLQELLSFFSDLGIPTRSFSGWYYPASEEAHAVSGALLARASSLGVRIRLSESARALKRLPDGRFEVRTDTWSYRSDAVIVSTGSPAGLPAGTDDSSGLLHAFSLPSEPFSPALVPLRTDHSLCAGWAGARARAQAALLVDGRDVQAESGQIQFGRKGLSGIPVFNLSIRAGWALSEGRRTAVRLDLLDGLPDRQALVLRLAELSAEAEAHRPGAENRLRLFLNGLIPERLASVLVREAHPLTALPQLLGGWTIPVVGTGSLPESQAARGGIRTSAVCPDTMMVRTVPGLYLTGELLEPVGHCGGFNLTFAWISGILAGKAAARGVSGPV